MREKRIKDVASFIIQFLFGVSKLQAIVIPCSYTLNALSLSPEISCQKQLTNYSGKKVLQFARRDVMENSFTDD